MSLRALALSAALLSACSTETFADLESGFFAALNVEDGGALAALPGYERRMDLVADDLLARAAAGSLQGDAERAEAGRALFYAGFLPHVAFHAVEDGYVPVEDRGAMAARMERSAVLLDRAAALRPTDRRIPTLQRSVRFNQEVLRGQPSPATLDAAIAAVRADLFDTFAALILLRDPSLHPMDAPYMERFFQAVCGPERFGCDRMGPPPLPMEPTPTLTRRVAGPVILSDLLLRRAEMLLRRADANPEVRTASLNEAAGRLQAARGTLGFAQLGASTLDHYPAAAHLEVRSQRISALLAAVNARLMDAPSPPPLPDGSFYAGRAYRAAYQCVSCHTRAPGSTDPAFPQ
jgi:hypothetical protein